jgi:hypothetical protein
MAKLVYGDECDDNIDNSCGSCSSQFLIRPTVMFFWNTIAVVWQDWSHCWWISGVSEHELLESLPTSRQCIDAEEQLLRLLYESKLKKYQAPSESLPPPPSALASNLDLAVAQAERHYYNCNYQQCSRITDE